MLGTATKVPILIVAAIERKLDAKKTFAAIGPTDFVALQIFKYIFRNPSSLTCVEFLIFFKIESY